METVATPGPETSLPSDAIPAATAEARVPALPWWRRLLQSGAGLAIGIEDGHLDVMVVRVRPSGVKVVGWKRFATVADRPAAVVGAEILQFLRELGAAHLAAHVLLPRDATIVRTVQLPGVPDKDLNAALELQLESLHPYADQPVCFGAMRVGKTGNVLVGICREELVDRWISFFTEAGIKLSAIRITADVFHHAVRVLRTPPEGFLSRMALAGDCVELYGESPARPVYSALLYAPSAHAIERAFSDLRLGSESAGHAGAVEDLESLLAGPETQEQAEIARQYLPLYATALGAAGPFPRPSVNLLPQELRKGSNWAMVLPSLLLAALLSGMLFGLWLQQSWHQREYAQRLQAEITLLERQVAAGRRMDDEGERLQLRLQTLKEFRQRTQRDLDALLQLTNTIPESAWVNQLELTPDRLILAGEASQAGELLRLLDGSPAFAGSSFSMPLQRTGETELFRIQSSREQQP